MNRKATITALILVFLLTLTITTCEFLNKDMKLILPPYLYDADETMNKGNGIVQIFNYEETETIIELEIVPADQDNPNNQNDDSDDLSKILLIPSYATIGENTLSVEFECQAIDTEMTAPYYKDVTVRASSPHYNHASDIITVHDVTPAPTPTPSPDPTPESKITPNPRAEATPLPVEY